MYFYPHLGLHNIKNQSTLCKYATYFPARSESTQLRSCILSFVVTYRGQGCKSFVRRQTVSPVKLLEFVW